MAFKDPVKKKAYLKGYHKKNGDKIRARSRAYYAANKKKVGEYQKTYKARHPEGAKGYYRDKVVPRLYKPTRKCPPNCEACGVPFASTKKGSQCDHDHATNLFRGWLCTNCNVALGYAKDSRVILQKLIDYLDNCELLA